jgi:hypothetical protein
VTFSTAPFFATLNASILLTSFIMALSIERQFPGEMLDHIISCTAPETLATLCRVSKQFNRLAIPRIYSTISLGYTGVSSNNQVRISFLAHLLFTCPAYAKLVTSVVVAQMWG